MIFDSVRKVEPGVGGPLYAQLLEANGDLAEAETVLGELYRYITEARAELHKALPPAPEAPGT